MECRKFTRFIVMRLVAPVAFAAAVVSLGSEGFSQSSSVNSGQQIVGSRLSPGMVNERGEEIVGRGSGFAAVLTLQDDNLQALLSTGRVEIEIPTQLINNVDSVIIKRPFYFKEKRASDYADTQLRGQRLFLNVDDAVVERIDYQPVELRVYESDFTSVVLNYIGNSRSIRPSKELGDPTTDSPMVTIKLISGKGIRGRIRGMKAFKLDSSLGKIDVPFSRSQSIEVGDNGELRIEMVNGDRVSGMVEGGEIELINRWGTETISMSDISILKFGTSNKNNTQRQKPNTKPVVNLYGGQFPIEISQPSTLNQ